MERSEQSFEGSDEGPNRFFADKVTLESTSLRLVAGVVPASLGTLLAVWAVKVVLSMNGVV
jgi:hypothetical protein